KLLRRINPVLNQSKRGIAVFCQSFARFARTIYALVNAVNIILTPASATHIPIRYFEGEKRPDEPSPPRPFPFPRERPSFGPGGRGPTPSPIFFWATPSVLVTIVSITTTSLLHRDTSFLRVRLRLHHEIIWRARHGEF